VVLSLAIDLARSLVRKRPLRTAMLKQHLKRFLKVAFLGRLDYLEVFDPETLLPVKEAKRGTRLALAVFFGKTRLIDNGEL
jgi:pantoate--beta-alanine ligase